MAKATDPNQPTTLIRIRDVMSMTGISKSQIYRLSNMGEFPKPTRLTAQSVAWVKQEVEQWINDKIQARNELEGAA
ncbi:MAG: AlpA family transcriptional regulator [Thiomicrospira sp.]